MSRIQIFVSFDIDHDAELYEQLLAQSESPHSGFEVLGGSELSARNVWNEGARSRIREADQVIVICGEYTSASDHVSAELRVADEEGTPYFLLWGRREIMCTKPVGARPADGMYSWTRQILDDRFAYLRRNAHSDVAAQTLRNPARKSGLLSETRFAAARRTREEMSVVGRVVSPEAD